MKYTPERIKEKIRNGEYNFTSNSSSNSYKRKSAEEIQNELRNGTYSGIDLNYISEIKKQVAKSNSYKIKENNISENKTTSYSASERAASELIKNQNKTASNSSLNAKSYEQQKDELKADKKEALGNRISTWFKNIGTHIDFNATVEDEKEASLNYQNAKKEHQRISDALEVLKENKWTSTQDENAKIISSNSELQTLLEQARNAKIKADSAQTTAKNFTNINDPNNVASNLAVQQQQKEYQTAYNEYADIVSKINDLGYDDAESLLDTYTRQKNLQETEQFSGEVSEFADEHPVLASGAYVALNSAQTAALPEIIGKGLESQITDEYIPIDINSGAFGATNIRDTISETTSTNIENTVKEKTDSEFLANASSFLYQTGLSMGDFASLAALPQPVSLAIMGSSAAVSTAKDATERGISADDALATATAAAAAEVFFEKFSLEGLQALKASGKSGIKNAVKDVLKQSFTEGSEEFFTDISNAITDQIINGSDSALSQQYEKLVADGLTEEEAKKQVAVDFGKQLGQSFLGGAISGGVMGSGASLLNNIQANSAYRAEGTAIRSLGDDAVAAVINEGLAQNSDSPAYRAATQMLKKNTETDAYEIDLNVSDRKLGKLQQLNVQSNDISEFSKAVSSESNANNLVDAFTKIVNGENISHKEVNEILNNKKARQALGKLTDIDSIDNGNVSSKKLIDEISQVYRASSMSTFSTATPRLTEENARNRINNGISYRNQLETETQSNIIDKNITLPDGSSDYIAGKNSVNKVENGKVYLNTSGGSVVEADQVDFANSDTQLLYESAGVYNTDEAKSYIMGYSDNGYDGTVADYSNGFGTVYKAQKQGKSFDEAYQLAIENGSHITPIQAEIAYDAANNSGIVANRRASFNSVLNAPKKPGVTVIADNASKAQKAEIKVLGEYAKSIGREIVVVDDTEELGYGKANGFYKNGKIVLALNADGGMMSAYFGHELFHDLKVNSKKQAQKLQDFVIDYLKGRADYDYNARVDEIIELNKFTGTREQQVAQANEEIAANACFTVFSEQKNFERLVQQDKPLAQKVRDFFAEFIEKIKNALDSIYDRNAEYRALQNEEKAQEKILAMFDACLKASDMSVLDSNENVKFSLKETFDSNYDLDANIKKVSNMSPVADLSGNEFAKGNVNLITQVTEYFKSIGNKVNSKYGTVTLNRTGVKSSVSHGIGRNKAIAFKAVPDVIKNGEIIDYQQNYKKRGYDSAVFAAPITINNQPYFVAAVVRVEADNNSYYLHELAITKKEDATPFKTGTDQVGTPSGETSSIYSLLNKLQNVNKNRSLATTPSGANSFSQTSKTLSGITSIDNVPQNDTVVNNSNMQEEPKFSLKEPVEETRDLIAVHNTSEDKLIKTLELGGFPMPSIAIMKSKMAGSQGFGNISIVFDKDTVDPEIKGNVVYSADAYTPTKVNFDIKLDKDKANDLYFKAIDYEKANRNIPFALKSIRLEPENLTDRITNFSNIDEFIEYIAPDYSMKQFFLSENNNQIKEFVKKETRTEVSDEDAELFDYLIENIPDYRPVFSPSAWKEKYESDFDKCYADYYKKNFGFSDEQTSNILKNMSLIEKKATLSDAIKYKQNGKVSVKVEDDIAATEKLIDERINDKKYNKWLHKLFNNVIEKTGIRNNLDTYTPSGNRRSFEQLHYDVTLENIVKAMKEGQSQGKALFGNSLYGSVQTKYSSIPEIKNNSDRLQNIDQEEFDNQRKEFRARFYEIADSISKNGNNMSVEDLLCEAVMVTKTKSGMARYIEREGEGWINYKESAVDDLINLVSDIRKMPTQYFEAKPQRAVRFNEVAYVVIPDNASEELKSKLAENGVAYSEYESGNEQSRVDTLNSFDDVKFSRKESIDVDEFSKENDDYSYNKLVSKPDMPFTNITDGINYRSQRITRKDIINKAVDNAKKVGRENDNGNAVIYVYDIAKEIIVPKKAIQHSLDRRIEVNGPVVTNIGNILKNSIRINELIPRSDNIEKSYVLIGAAKNQQNEPFIVSFVVNEFTNEVKSIDVLYSVNAKKEPAGSSKSPKLSTASTGSAISISDLLDYVNRYYPDVLPEDVLRHYGYSDRPDGVIGESALYSLKEQPIDYNAILRENDELAQMNEDLKRMLELSSSQNEKLKNEFKITGRHNLSNNAVDRVATRLRKQYASTYDKTSLVYNLSALYDYIANAGTDIDSGYIWTAAHNIAMNIVDNTQQKDTAVYDEYKNLRERIRNTAIRVPETVRDGFTDYEQFRKSNFGRLRLSNNSGIELDSFYNELSAEYPEFFDTQASEEQQLESLVNFFESTAPVYYNASENTADSMGLNMQQYSNLVAGDIIEKYFDIPEVKTVAENHKKEIDSLKLHYRNKISELRQSYKERYDERLNEVREENRKRVNKLRQDKVEALAKQKAHFEDVSKRGRERRNKSKLRASIRKSLNKIASLGANPDKKKHIPNAIIDSVKAFADAVALDDTKQDQKIRDRLNQFRNGFESIKKGDSQYAVISELYNDFIREQIIELQNTVGSKTIKELSVSELEQIDKLVKMTAQSISNINRLFNKDRNATIEQYADNIASELEPFRKGKIRNTPLNSLAFNSLKPEYFFQYIGSDTLSDLYHDLRKGEDTWAVDVSQARKFALEIRKKYGWKKWDTKAKQKFSTAYGEIELSLQERLGIYANSLGEHTKNHLLGGGFKYQQSKATGIAKLKKQTNDNSSHRLSEDDVSNIVASLSEEQKAYVRDMITYLSTVMGEKGNEISRQLYDIELFKEKMYYPAKVDRESTHQSTKEVRAEKQIKNAGFTNAAIENAKQPLILMDFDEVWASHVDEMSKYHAFVLPLENLDRVYNLYEVDSDNKYSSVKEIIKNAYGTKALAYIDDLIRDINGGVVQEAGTDILSSLTSKFKKNAVFASASVTIQQPSAIARALSEIDAKYFAQTTGSGFNRKAYEEMKKYAPVAIIKEMGYFDTNMAQSTVDYLNKNDYNGLKEKAKAFVVDGSYRDDAMSFFASKADEITWTHIWNAVKAEIRAKNPELSGNSEQLLSKAGERFTEVITKTQVYDSVFSRSGLMRSRDNAVKNAMAFMAEPTTSLNMLTNAVMQAKRGKISKAKAGRIFASLISASLLNSILQSIVTAARADDDDKDWKEIYLAQLLPNFIDNLNPVNQIAFVKDIYNIFQGYDVTRADMNLFSDLYNAIQRLGSDNVSAYDKVTGLAGAIAAFFGFPLKNIIRDFNAAKNVVKDAFDDVHFDRENALDTFKEEMNSYLGFELFNSKYENAVKSIENGKMTDYEQYADELYAGSEAYDLLYAILKKYGYNSSQYKKEADRCIEVKKENGSSNPNPDTAMKNRAIKEYAYLKENGTYTEAEAARQRCIQLYDDATKVKEALEKLND